MKKKYFYTLFLLLLLFFNKNIFPGDTATYSLNIPNISVVNIDSNTTLNVDFNSRQGKEFLLSPNSSISALSNAKSGYQVTVDQVPEPANSPNDFILTEDDPAGGSTNTIAFRLVKGGTTTGWQTAAPTTGILLRKAVVFEEATDNPINNQSTLQMLINYDQIRNASHGIYSCNLKLTLTDNVGT